MDSQARPASSHIAPAAARFSQRHFGGMTCPACSTMRRMLAQVRHSDPMHMHMPCRSHLPSSTSPTPYSSYVILFLFLHHVSCHVLGLWPGWCFVGLTEAYCLGSCHHSHARVSYRSCPVRVACPPNPSPSLRVWCVCLLSPGLLLVKAGGFRHRLGLGASRIYVCCESIAGMGGW